MNKPIVFLNIFSHGVFFTVVGTVTVTGVEGQTSGGGWHTQQTECIAQRELVSDVWVVGTHLKNAFWCLESLSCPFF